MVGGNAYTEYLMLLLIKRPTPPNLSIGLHWYSKEYPGINKVLADSSSSHVSETARISMFKMASRLVISGSLGRILQQLICISEKQALPTNFIAATLVGDSYLQLNNDVSK